EMEQKKAPCPNKFKKETSINLDRLLLVREEGVGQPPAAGERGRLLLKRRDREERGYRRGLERREATGGWMDSWSPLGAVGWELRHRTKTE
ncbi:unnamed protein product, partial [Citrullus colocynthis]